VGVTVGVAVGVALGVVVGVGVTLGVAVGVGVAVAGGVTVGVAVGVALGVAVGVTVGVGVGVDMGPIYDWAITTLSYHFLLMRALCWACKPICASSILSVLMERTFRFGKAPTTVPSIQNFTSPLFCPGVFARTINS
jgi:hypothetical protein